MSLNAKVAALEILKITYIAATTAIAMRIYCCNQVRGNKLNLSKIRMAFLQIVTMLYTIAKKSILESYV